MISTSEARERRDRPPRFDRTRKPILPSLFEYVEGLVVLCQGPCQGVLLAANHHLVALYGFKTEDEFIGHTDFDSVA